MKLDNDVYEWRSNTRTESQEKKVAHFMDLAINTWFWTIVLKELDCNDPVMTIMAMYFDLVDNLNTIKNGIRDVTVAHN